MDQVDDRLKKNPDDLHVQFMRVVLLGLRQFKTDFLDDPSFLIRVHCFAQASGATQIVEMITPALRKNGLEDADFANVVRILLDKESQLAQKVLMLHGKGSDADFLEQFYISRLSASEKKRPEIARILAENAINAREYEAALALIESISDEFKNDSQVLFWQAWTLFALHKDGQALKVLDQIVTNHPESKWATTAGVYAEGIRYFSEYQKANSEELLEISRVLKEGIGVLEANAEYLDDADSKNVRTYVAYVGIVPDENRLEFCLHKGNNLFLAYRTTASNSAIYLEGEPRTLVFKKPAPIPVPSISLSRADNGKFFFQAGLAMESLVKEAGAKASTLLDSPYLSTPEGITALLEYLARHHGWVPSKPVTAKKGTTFVWHIPSTDSPDTKLLDYHVSADHRITNLNYGNFCLKSLTYSTKNAYPLKPPSWPKRPVNENGEFDFSAMIKLVGAIADIRKPQQ
jgi:tetratricopeptide (TPR) repeat protein